MDFEEMLKKMGFGADGKPMPQPAERCISARRETKPLPCQFAPLGKIVYCKIHNGIKV